MTASKVVPPPVNLKERIAAIEQRNASSTLRPVSPTPAPSPTLHSAGLRDKIAKFEKKGGVPVPRGSFGLGAPPLAENGPAKRRGELYGNRIPSAVRPSAPTAGPSRAASPFESARSFSSPPSMDMDDSDGSPDTSNFPSTPSSPSSPPLLDMKPPPRAIPFATAMELALKTEASAESPVVETPHDSHEPSQEPVDPVADEEVEDNPPDAVVSLDDVEPADTQTPSDAVVKDGLLSSPISPDQHSTATDTVVLQDIATNTPAEHVTVPIPTTSPIITDAEGPSHPEPTSIEVVAASTAAPVIKIDGSGTETADAPPSASPPDDATPISSKPPSQLDIEVSAPSNADAAPKPSNDVAPSADKEEPLQETHAERQDTVRPKKEVVPQTPATAGRVLEVPKTPFELDLGLSPIQSPTDAARSPEPVTLAEAVHKLARSFANIQDMFPDQVSPLESPLTYRAMRLDAEQLGRPESESSTPVVSKKTKPVADLKIEVEEVASAYDATESVTQQKDEAIDSVPVKHQSTDQQSIIITQSPELMSEADKAKASAAINEETSQSTAKSPDHLSVLSAPYSAPGRPISMFEMSPSHVVQGHRMTPLTSRGVPMFIPPTHTSKPDYLNFPPTPHVNDSEFSSGSRHGQSRSFSHPSVLSPDSEMEQQRLTSGLGRGPSFSAVVHRKVTELPPAVGPQTPLRSRIRQSFLHAEPPTSPGFGDLADLLHDAALLEQTLSEGQLPSEIKTDSTKLPEKTAEEIKDVKSPEEVSFFDDSDSQYRSSQEQTSKPKNPFNLLRTKSSHRKERSAPAEPQPRVKSSYLPDSQKVPQVLEKHSEADSTEGESDASPKSRRHYFSGLRRLTSTSRSSNQSSSHPRYSASTSSEISSEDHHLAYDRSVESTRSGPGSTPPIPEHDSSIPWPSSLNKSTTSVHRTTSFADKIWPRSRSKSSLSAKSAYDTIDRITQSAAAKAAAASIPQLDPIPLSFDFDGPDSLSPPGELVSPRRSASLNVSGTSSFSPSYAAVPTSPVYTPAVHAQANPLATPGTAQFSPSYAPVPTSPVYTPAAHAHATASLRAESETTYLSIDSLLHPLPSPIGSQSSTRPSSFVSVESSASSIPSPLFDSFPSVPTTTPVPPLSASSAFAHTPASASASANVRRKLSRPSLPPSGPSFFESTPISSTPVGSEFTFSATLPRSAAPTPRSVSMPPPKQGW